MKHKYSLPSRIRNAVEWHLESYPGDKRKLEQAKRDEVPSPTPAYSLSAGGGSASRKTEAVALRIMSAPYLRRLEETCEAVEKALARGDDLDRKMVDLVYWRREFTVSGAALALNLSCSGAYKRINKVLVSVAVELGYINF